MIVKDGRGCDMRKVAFAFVVLGSLLVLASATSNSSIFSEDSDGDGLPDIVEEQVGTDPYDPSSYIYVMGINDEDLTEEKIAEIEGVSGNTIDLPEEIVKELRALGINVTVKDLIEGGRQD